jgi:hypothetical protein
MAKFFSRNLERSGRILRAILGSALMITGVVACFWDTWAGVGLIGGAVFVLFEAIRGWCLVRACGIKTRI